MNLSKLCTLGPQLDNLDSLEHLDSPQLDNLDSVDHLDSPQLDNALKWLKTQHG